MNFKALSILPMLLLACEDQAAVSVQAESKSCGLSLDNLNGSEWLFLRSEQGKADTPDVKSRIKFVKEGDSLKAKYTVASLSDLYTYNCRTTDGQLTCAQEPDYKRWCETLMANGRKCSLNSFQKLDEAQIDSDEMKKGVSEAEKVFKDQKAGKAFKRYQNTYNSLGNKLQGLLYIRVDEKNCRLRVTDNYMTYYNGKRLEDSNPNGINAFVKNEVGDLLWEDCETSQLFDTTFATYPDKPEDIQPVGKHAVGTEVHYWLLHEPLRYGKEGCTYSFDTYHNYKLDQKGLTPEIIEVGGKKELRWKVSKKYDSATSKGNSEILMMVTKSNCEGSPEKRITGCNKSSIK